MGERLPQGGREGSTVLGRQALPARGILLNLRRRAERKRPTLDLKEANSYPIK